MRSGGRDTTAGHSGFNRLWAVVGLARWYGWKTFALAWMKFGVGWGCDRVGGVGGCDRVGGLRLGGDAIGLEGCDRVGRSGRGDRGLHYILHLSRLEFCWF